MLAVMPSANEAGNASSKERSPASCGGQVQQPIAGAYARSSLGLALSKEGKQLAVREGRRHKSREGALHCYAVASEPGDVEGRLIRRERSVFCFIFADDKSRLPDGFNLWQRRLIFLVSFALSCLVLGLAFWRSLWKRRDIEQSAALQNVFARLKLYS